MTLLPIVAREMRVAARLRGTYRLRFATALLALVVSGFLMATMWNQTLFETGRFIFVAVSWLAFLLCLLSGLWLTSDSLSEEKRAGTLGLLFLTDLRGYDVVIGKLAANSINALFCALSVIPVLMLTLLLGGITFVEVLRTALALVCALHFSLCTGLLVSALCHSARKALVLTFAILLAASAIAPIAGVILENYLNDYTTKSEYIAGAIFIFSPGTALVMSGSSQYPNAPWIYWGAIGMAQFLGWVFLLAACLLIPHRWQEKSAVIKEGSLTGKWHRFWMGGAKWRSRFRLRALAANPYFWLASRARWGRYMVWMIFPVTGFFWAWGWLENRRHWFDTEVYVTTTLLLGGALKLWMALSAANRLGEERRTGALEQLLATPLSEGDILRGQWRALRRVFLWPSVLLTVIVIAFMLHDASNQPHFMGWNPFSILFFMAKDLTEQMEAWKWICYLLAYWADWLTLGWLGMWLSLRLARGHRATVLTSLLVLPLPWILWGFGSLAVVLMVELLRRSGMIPNTRLLNTPIPFYALWTAICLGVDLLLVWYSRWRLRRFFRLVAGTPVGVRPRYRQTLRR